MVFITKRFQAAYQAALTAFRNPAPVKSWYGVSDLWYGGGGGLTSGNRDLTYTEHGAATAFAIIVEVQRGVMFIADSIAMLPAAIYDSRTKQKLLDINTRENLNLTLPGATFVAATRAYERAWKHNFIESIIWSDWLYGETFVVRLPNAAGGIAGVRWLNPICVEPTIMRGRIEDYQYSADDGYYRIPVRDMAFRIHHRNPQEDLRGLSPVLSALPSMNIERNAERGIMSYFRNGMILGGVMMPDAEGATLNEPQIGKLQQEMKQHHEGVDKGWRWVIAPKRMAFNQFEQPDLQKNYSVVKDASKKIMMALGVPPELAGNPDSVSYDNADKIMKNWLLVNGKAYAGKLAGYINTSLLSYFEPGVSCYFDFDFTEIDRQDAALVQSDFSAGIIPMNEVQAQRGYEVDPLVKNIYIIGGKPVHRDVLIEVSRDIAAFTGQPPAPALPATMTIPGQSPLNPPALQGEAQTALPEVVEPAKGAASLCVMLSLANNPDLIALQNKLKLMMNDPAVRWNDPADFHITLLYVPAVDEDQVQQMVTALPGYTHDGLALRIGSLASFDSGTGEHALYYGIRRHAGLLELQEDLHDTGDSLGLQMSSYSRPGQYIPHITMCYVPDHVKKVKFVSRLTVEPTDVLCSVERGGVNEIVWKASDLIDDTKSITPDVMLAVWDEDKHPRDDSGQFGSGGGGNGTQDKPKEKPAWRDDYPYVAHDDNGQPEYVSTGEFSKPFPNPNYQGKPTGKQPPYAPTIQEAAQGKPPETPKPQPKPEAPKPAPDSAPKPANVKPGKKPGWVDYNRRKPGVDSEGYQDYAGMDNNKPAENRAYEMSEAHTSKLSPKQIDAAQTYTGGDYAEINGGLRQGKVPREYQSTVKNLDSAIDQSKLSENTVLYRGMSLSPERMANMKPGAVISDKAYLSTSINPRIPDSFARGEGKTLMRIKANAGQKGLAVNNISNFDGEHEILLPRGSQYRITGVSRDRRTGMTYIDAELLGEAA